MTFMRIGGINSLAMVVCLLMPIVFISGCVIPWPHAKQTCGSISGNVIDEDSKKPIENAYVEISYPDGDKRQTCTNEYGFFYFPEKKSFYWGILFGVALNHSLPIDHYPYGFSSLEFKAQDFESCSVTLRDYYDNMRNFDPNNLHEMDEYTDYLPFLMKHK